MSDVWMTQLGWDVQAQKGRTEFVRKSQFAAKRTTKEKSITVDFEQVN